MGQPPSKADTSVHATVSIKDGEMSSTKDQQSNNRNLSMSLSFSHLTMDSDSTASASARSGVPLSTSGTPSYEALNAMVSELGGDKPIHSVLVANNGLAAVKFMRSVRNWAFKRFGDERAIKLIAMATPEDMLADAEHIRLADQFIEVAGGRNVNNYANVQLIVSLAVRAQVDAVWPGWGHASEKPELPELLLKTPNGVRFVGPDQYAMAALGDKIGSTILAQSAGVPTLAWSGDGVEITYDACQNGEIPDDIYDRACLHNVSEAVRILTTTTDDALALSITHHPSRPRLARPPLARSLARSPTDPFTHPVGGLL